MDTVAKFVSVYGRLALGTAFLSAVADLPDVPGRELLIETVVRATREIASAHRHDVGVFAGALKGRIITRVEGGESQTVHAGEGFYESPTDLHLESRNASTADPQLVSSFL